MTSYGQSAAKNISAYLDFAQNTWTSHSTDVCFSRPERPPDLLLRWPPSLWGHGPAHRTSCFPDRLPESREVHVKLRVWSLKFCTLPGQWTYQPLTHSGHAALWHLVFRHTASHNQSDGVQSLRTVFLTLPDLSKYRSSRCAEKDLRLMTWLRIRSYIHTELTVKLAPPTWGKKWTNTSVI